jgi:hypothetical protein
MKKAEQPDELLLSLHERLLFGDRTASEEVAGRLLSSLVAEVSRKFPATDRGLVCDGVTDAILDYCMRPAQFDRKRGVPLARFLQMASWRNVANLVRGEKRRKVWEERATADPQTPGVELDPAAGKVKQEEDGRREKQKVEMFNSLTDPTDRRILELRFSGERSTEVFAKVLGISGLPLNIQRRKVKQAKDRIEKVLRRRGGMNL